MGSVFSDNFLTYLSCRTYDECEFSPGPYLNVLAAPNGKFCLCFISFMHFKLDELRQCNMNGIISTDGDSFTTPASL